MSMIRMPSSAWLIFASYLKSVAAPRSSPIGRY
jgi:hypothetical protein